MDIIRLAWIGLEISLLALLSITLIEMFSDLMADIKDYKENN